MVFRKKIWVEQFIKYVVIFGVIVSAWTPIREGLVNASSSGKLESIAVIMGLISLCALTGYFAFSYTVVGKKPLQRFFGYVCAALLTIPLILTWLILYFIASIWIPEMKFVWGLILLSLYVGAFIFDNLDISRMGRDVAAVSFYEKGYAKDPDALSATINFLKKGQRLEFANNLIGQAIFELGKSKKNSRLQKAGEWIMENSKSPQHEIDLKVAEIFSEYAKHDKRISDIVDELSLKQKQSTADLLIANLLELVKEK